MSAEFTALPSTQELIRADERQLPGLLDNLRGAITGPCDATKRRAMDLIRTTLDICHPELPLARMLGPILEARATTYEACKGSDYTERHYNF